MGRFSVSMLTISRKIGNSALGSWAGYIYQGLCGIYHVLSLLKEDMDKYRNYSLNIDSYEDFSILNDVNKVVSLHQCKDEKAIKDYKDEQSKMKQKLDYYISQGWVSDICSLYFHNAHEISVDKDITLYKYPDGNCYCLPDNIFSFIRDVVEELKPVNQSSDVIVCSLSVLVDEVVLKVQSKYFSSNKELLRDIARNEAMIPFQRVIDIVFCTSVLSVDRKNIFSVIRNRLCLHLNSLVLGYQQEPDVDFEKINNFISQFHILDLDHVREFFKRINPHISFRSDWDFIMELGALEKATLFSELLLDVKEPLRNSTFDWQSGDKKLSPSTMFSTSTRMLNNLCRFIVQNSANLDCLREYDWLVGSVNESVASISHNANVFNKIAQDKNNSYESIFAVKDVGILSIQDKNNGTFG